jgi:hypothetical protein
MKLILVAVISWLLGLVTHLIPMYLIFDEPPSTADLIGVGGASLIFSLLVFFLVYTPGLFWLRRRRAGCQPAIHFPIASTILTIPILLVIGLRVSKSFSTGEALLFMIQFLVAGICFGFGFVWYCRRKVA